MIFYRREFVVATFTSFAAVCSAAITCLWSLQLKLLFCICVDNICALHTYDVSKLIRAVVVGFVMEDPP